MNKEQLKRIIDLMLLGIVGLQDTEESVFRGHIYKVSEEIKKLVDDLKI